MFDRLIARTAGLTACGLMVTAAASAECPMDLDENGRVGGEPAEEMLPFDISELQVMEEPEPAAPEAEASPSPDSWARSIALASFPLLLRFSAGASLAARIASAHSAAALSLGALSLIFWPSAFSTIVSTPPVAATTTSPISCTSIFPFVVSSDFVCLFS